MWPLRERGSCGCGGMRGDPVITMLGSEWERSVIGVVSIERWSESMRTSHGVVENVFAVANVIAGWLSFGTWGM
jgi:hypothetical protein